jgi:uncharacterized protein (DUF885 family)
MLRHLARPARHLPRFVFAAAMSTFVPLAVPRAEGQQAGPAVGAAADTQATPPRMGVPPEDAGLGAMITRYGEDRKSLEFKYRPPLSDTGHERMWQFYRAHAADLAAIPAAGLRGAAAIDHQLMKQELEYRIAIRGIEADRDRKVRELIPAIGPLVEMLEQHEGAHQVDAKATAQRLVAASESIRKWLPHLGPAVSPAEGDAADAIDPAIALHAAATIDQLLRGLDTFHRFYLGYDPLYSWWCRLPYETLVKDCSDLRAAMTRIGGGDDPDKIIGIPCGEAAMALELAHEMIPYSPEELIEIAEREFAWCDEQMLAATAEMGFGDDWRAALESVKQKHVPPGEQPAMIRRLAKESADFIKERGLVTVPPLCDEVWRMEMMTPDRQRVNPFFLGGDTIIVSYPTDTMTHDEKLMSMRGNNEHFARATVHHELIPGHHLQIFMIDRYRSDRREFRTPFWIEGWALYWEMLMWDKGFARSPEDRIGMLFWRKHRCARIVFSLGFQLGRMTPAECVEYLIDRVGHERANATAEVRRSVAGDYPPLYQAAYMLGGLQIRALRAELVDSGKMSEVDFHDAILRQGPIPIAMVRAALMADTVPAYGAAKWRFGDGH